MSKKPTIDPMYLLRKLADQIVRLTEATNPTITYRDHNKTVGRLVDFGGSTIQIETSMHVRKKQVEGFKEKLRMGV